jgi:hypothetical protein
MATILSNFSNRTYSLSSLPVRGSGILPGFVLRACVAGLLAGSIGLVSMPAQAIPTASVKPITPAPQSGSVAIAQSGATQGASIAIYLADTEEREGWTKVPVQSGFLYINPQAILTRADLISVEAGENDQQAGLLAMDLSEAGQKKLGEITALAKQGRLALIVGQTLVAAPAFDGRLNDARVIFPVGKKDDAEGIISALTGEAATK